MNSKEYEKRALNRFWAKVNKTDNCWEWIGHRTPNGYGDFRLRPKYNILLAHRFSYLIFYGKLTKGLCIMHKCDNPPCVNPEHLKEGTLAENCKDMWNKGRATCMYAIRNMPKKLNKEQVYEIKKSYLKYKLPARVLAEKYGVGMTTIFDIVKNKRYVYTI